MKKKIRALLLSAGFGTRLQPLTLDIPKCLVKVSNKPILEEWIDKLIKIKAEKILINTHYKAKQVEDFIKTQKQKGIQIYTTYESELLGTAKTLIVNKEFFKNSFGILIHVDNYSKINLEELINAHVNRPQKCLLTMLTFNTKNPETCGIIKKDNRGVLKEFFEKDINFNGNIANGAVYLFDDDFLKWLIKYYPNARDFSTEIIPNLLRRIFTCHTHLDYIDIGTPESLLEARKLSEISE